MNLLITGAWNGAKDNFEYISNLGHCVSFLQNERDELPLPYDEVEGVICNGLFLYHPIERFTNLKYIQLTSAGFDSLYLTFLTTYSTQYVPFLSNLRHLTSKLMWIHNILHNKLEDRIH